MWRVDMIVNSTDTRSGRLFDAMIQALIVLSLVSLSLETLPSISPVQRAYLEWFETLSVMIFSVEYILRLVVASNRFAFVTSFFGVIDLAAILPFYLATGIDLRAVRAVRLVRVFRVLKLARYSKAVRRFHIAFRLAREELVLFAAVALIVLYLSSVGIFYFENAAQPDAFPSIPHSMWWAIVTLTTVGYGDTVPITTGGRLFTSVVVLVGLGLVSIPSGIIATALASAREVQAENEERV